MTEATRDLSTQMRARALNVRPQHSDGRTCPECPSGDNGRCPVLAIWRPVIMQIEAEKRR